MRWGWVIFSSVCSIFGFVFVWVVFFGRAWVWCEVRWVGLLRSLVECCVCARVLVKQVGFRVGFRFMAMSVSFFRCLCGSCLV